MGDFWLTSGRLRLNKARRRSTGMAARAEQRAAVVHAQALRQEAPLPATQKNHPKRPRSLGQGCPTGFKDPLAMRGIIPKRRYNNMAPHSHNIETRGIVAAPTRVGTTRIVRPRRDNKNSTTMQQSSANAHAVWQQHQGRHHNHHHSLYSQIPEVGYTAEKPFDTQASPPPLQQQQSWFAEHTADEFDNHNEMIKQEQQQQHFVENSFESNWGDDAITRPRQWRRTTTPQQQQQQNGGGIWRFRQQASTSSPPPSNKYVTTTRGQYHYPPEVTITSVMSDIGSVSGEDMATSPEHFAVPSFAPPPSVGFGDSGSYCPHTVGQGVHRPRSFQLQRYLATTTTTTTTPPGSSKFGVASRASNVSPASMRRQQFIPANASFFTQQQYSNVSPPPPRDAQGPISGINQFRHAPQSIQTTRVFDGSVPNQDGVMTRRHVMPGSSNGFPRVGQVQRPSPHRATQFLSPRGRPPPIPGIPQFRREPTQSPPPFAAYNQTQAPGGDAMEKGSVSIDDPSVGNNYPTFWQPGANNQGIERFQQKPQPVVEVPPFFDGPSSTNAFEPAAAVPNNQVPPPPPFREPPGGIPRFQNRPLTHAPTAESQQGPGPFQEGLSSCPSPAGEGQKDEMQSVENQKLDANRSLEPRPAAVNYTIGQFQPTVLPEVRMPTAAPPASGEPTEASRPTTVNYCIGQSQISRNEATVPAETSITSPEESTRVVPNLTGADMPVLQYQMYRAPSSPPQNTPLQGQGITTNTPSSNFRNRDEISPNHEDALLSPESENPPPSPPLTPNPNFDENVIGMSFFYGDKQVDMHGLLVGQSNAPPSPKRSNETVPLQELPVNESLSASQGAPLEEHSQQDLDDSVLENLPLPMQRAPSSSSSSSSSNSSSSTSSVESSEEDIGESPVNQISSTRSKLSKPTPCKETAQQGKTPLPSKLAESSTNSSSDEQSFSPVTPTPVPKPSRTTGLDDKNYSGDEMDSDEDSFDAIESALENTKTLWG